MVKVFISWSGDRSKLIAEQFRKWLPGVIQAVTPYFSPDDIAKGSRWNTEISKELEASQVGIICLTRDNLEASWLMFEAGALSKNLDKGKVCPIMFGISPTDIKDPLAQFQCARFDRAEIKKLVKMINGELGEQALALDVIDSVFDMWWPELESAVNAILEGTGEEETTELRGDRELLEEILALSRRSSSARSTSRVHPNVVRDLVRGFHGIVVSAAENDILFMVSDALNELRQPLRYLLRKADTDRSRDYEQQYHEALEILDAESTQDDSDAGEVAEDENF